MVNNSTNEKNTTSQLKSMNTNMAMTYRDGKASPCLWQIHKCGRWKRLMESQLHPPW